ncbi:MAG: UDP-N-acetylmuramate dehydrogenase [Terriglobales bacterium]
MIVQENISLAPFTTLKVGGCARYFVEAGTITEVQEALQFAHSRNMPLFILGGGSNLVVSDAGWPGIVLKIAIVGIHEHIHNDRVIFEVGAGEPWDKFVATAVARNCAGVECLSGIPGSVGGTPIQNVGAYGQEVSETIQSVTTLHRDTGDISELNNEACGFLYRNSIFNTTHRERYIVLKVKYELMPGGNPHLEYADLRNHFAGWSETPTLADTREAVRRIRASKGMLITPGDDGCHSAGSFFKNPVLSEESFDQLIKRAADKNLQVPSYPAVESQRKVSAAWLVEHSGFSKGFVSGNVGISRKHALAIVNRGDASAFEVIALKNHIQDRVEDIWGIRLDPEPVFVGF